MARTLVDIATGRDTTLQEIYNNAPYIDDPGEGYIQRAAASGYSAREIAALWGNDRGVYKVLQKRPYSGPVCG